MADMVEKRDVVKYQVKYHRLLYRYPSSVMTAQQNTLACNAQDWWVENLYDVGLGSCLGALLLLRCGPALQPWTRCTADLSSWGRPTASLGMGNIVMQGMKHTQLHAIDLLHYTPSYLLTHTEAWVVSMLPLRLEPSATASRDHPGI